MKKLTLVLGLLSICLLGISAIYYKSANESLATIDKQQRAIDSLTNRPPEYILLDTIKVTDWKALWTELAKPIRYEESKGDSTAVNGNSAGDMQQEPIWVAECNAIIGQRGYYTLEDRYKPDKAFEMFMVINQFHNRERSLVKACKLHNPGGGQAYITRVLTEYQKRK